MTWNPEIVVLITGMAETCLEVNKPGIKVTGSFQEEQKSLNRQAPGIVKIRQEVI